MEYYPTAQPVQQELHRLLQRNIFRAGCLFLSVGTAACGVTGSSPEGIRTSISTVSPGNSNEFSKSTEPMESIVVMTYNVNDEVPVIKTMEYIEDAMQGTRKILGVQELRGKDKATGSKNKAQYVKEHLPVCEDPSKCESDGYIPEGRGGAVSIFADNEELKVVPEESTYIQLHDKKRILDKDGEKMVVFDKWLSIAMIEDKKTGFRFAHASTHLIRDLQIDGRLNTEAPDIFESLDQEMDTTEMYLQTYLGRGYSVVLSMDTNWDHDTKTIPISPPGRLAKMGFVSIYNAPGIVNKSPNINGTHYKPDNGSDTRNLDALYLANPINPKQPFVLEFTWRENYGPDAPSDHNLVAASIEAVPYTPAFIAKICAALPKDSVYC